MFRQRKETPTGSQTKLMVETRDAMVGMVVAYNDRPLNQEQRQGEYGRIQRFSTNPPSWSASAGRKKKTPNGSRASLKHCQTLSSTNTTAPKPAEPGLGKPGNPLVRLKFRPNPKLRAADPCRAGSYRHAGRGSVDPQEQHIARIDGTLFQGCRLRMGHPRPSGPWRPFPGRSDRRGRRQLVHQSHGTGIHRQSSVVQESQYQVDRDLLAIFTRYLQI